MKRSETERLLDPIWGLVAFRGENASDRLAWNLIQTPAFQRLRRIRQLGLADLVFPGATHTRFSHSIGVFTVARQLLKQLRRRLGEKFNEDRACIALIAALLHDIGHGPLSHAFEAATEGERHELWSARLVRGNAEIAALLAKENLQEPVAELLGGKGKKDIYAAIVSGQFDADRLDYLLRDRYMTGVKSGGFDFEWLLDCLDCHQIEGKSGAILCLSSKGLRNAEEYVLARFFLYANVYLHKTARAAEKMLHLLLTGLRQKPDLLHPSHPLRLYFEVESEGEPSPGLYLSLDDAHLWQAVRETAQNPKSGALGKLAARLWRRDLYKCLDISHAPELDAAMRKKLGEGAFADEISFSAYGFYAASDETKRHEKIFIFERQSGSLRDLAELSPLVQQLTAPRILSRLYFENEAKRNQTASALGLK